MSVSNAAASVDTFYGLSADDTEVLRTGYYELRSTATGALDSSHRQLRFGGSKAFQAHPRPA
jgi:hypothetical protein